MEESNLVELLAEGVTVSRHIRVFLSKALKEGKLVSEDSRTSPFKVLCDGLICSFVKRGANVLGGEKNVARAGV